MLIKVFWQLDIYYLMPKLLRKYLGIKKLDPDKKYKKETKNITQSLM